MSGWGQGEDLQAMTRQEENRLQSRQCEGGLVDPGENIDAVIFGQILEMDDGEDDRKFSRSTRSWENIVPMATESMHY